MDTTKNLLEQRLKLYIQMKLIVQEQIIQLAAPVDIESVEVLNRLSEERQHIQEKINHLESQLSISKDTPPLQRTGCVDLHQKTTECVLEIMKLHEQMTHLLTEATRSIGASLNHFSRFKNAMGSYESQVDHIALYIDEKK